MSDHNLSWYWSYSVGAEAFFTLEDIQPAISVQQSCLKLHSVYGVLSHRLLKWLSEAADFDLTAVLPRCPVSKSAPSSVREEMLDLSPLAAESWRPVGIVIRCTDGFLCLSALNVSDTAAQGASLTKGDRYSYWHAPQRRLQSDHIRLRWFIYIHKDTRLWSHVTLLWRTRTRAITLFFFSVFFIHRRAKKKSPPGFN